MVICRNDPHPGDFSAGSLLYKGHMIQMLVITDTVDYFHDPRVQIWHLFKYQRCYGNKNGRQNWPKIEKLSFWTKFKALEDILFEKNFSYVVCLDNSQGQCLHSSKSPSTRANCAQRINCAKRIWLDGVWQNFMDPRTTSVRLRTLHSTARAGLEIFVWTYSSCGASGLNFSLVLTPVELVLNSGFKNIFQKEYNLN